MPDQSTNGQLPFVELNRRFRKLEQDAKSEDAAFESYTTALFGGKSGYGWDDLIKENRVVILGEPGSGKTWELREQAKLLVARNEFAFFIRLDQLINRDLIALFSAEERQLFTRWKQSTASAYFFLDSVDEAKFRKLSDFYSTLERLAKELGDGLLMRTKILLSSRISEWKPASDAFEVRRLFPLPPTLVRTDSDGESKPAKEEKPVPLVVHIQPLDQSQVECFARANSVQNVSAFIQALDRAFAWEFARRPLDVSELITFWKANGRIGSLTELVELDLVTKLRPRANRDEHQLSENEAFVGATWLAAANLFCRKFSFSVTDDLSADAEALNPGACLPPEWRDEQSRALLNRAIFDSAVYGRFRFHHRRIGEFLAAKWIAARMESGCPQSELEHLLVESVRGQKIFRPAMRPVAAWLCAGNSRWNQLVRRLVVEIDPEIHLNFGDATSLATEYRREILRALAVRSKQRRRTWIQTSHDSLSRFAEPALSPDIKELILDRTLAADYRVEMLEIVRHGRLVDCLDAAIAVIAADEEPEELKQYAALAIGAIESPEVRVQLARVMTQLVRIPNRLCAAAVQALYPNHISSAELVAILAKSERVREFSYGLPHHLKEHFESVLLPNDAAGLLKELIALLQQQPHTQHGHKTVPVSEQFHWVGKLVPTIIAKLFEKAVLSPTEVDAAAEAFQLLGYIRECHHSDYSTDEIRPLNDLARKQPLVRQRYFWRIAAAYRIKNKTEPERMHALFDYWEVLRLSVDDFDWLLAETSQRTGANDRLLALRCAIEVWDDARRPLLLRWRLRGAAKRERVLWNEYQQSVFTDLLIPLKRFWFRCIHHKYGKWWWLNKYRDLRGKRWWWREQFALYWNLKRIASGKPISWLEQLAREADKSNHSRWAMSSWADLEKKRGKRIALAAKRGCIAVWRGYTPPLPHEKPKPNESTIGLIVGLTGLQAELGENPDAISNLSEAEAALAARYAMDELNGFPEWLEVIAIKHYQAVQKVLDECVQGEWQFEASHENAHKVIVRLSWAGGMLCEMARPQLLKLLEAGSPPNCMILRAALVILTSIQSPPHAKLSALAAGRASGTEELAHRILWLSLWMQTDGERAVNWLGMMLKTAPNSDEIVAHLCSALSGERAERGPSIESPSYLEPQCLRRFIPIVYAHVRFGDDLDRSGGGAYSPTARDDAQRFRGVLLDNLAKSDAPSATAYLRELADEPSMSQIRDWILNLLDERLKRQSDFAPWTPSDLRSFAQHHEVDPKSDRELFAIAHKRIHELKLQVEASNNSLRDELRGHDTKEIHLRRWLARKLDERSRNRYSAPQEPEIDMQQRPDLQVLRPGLPPVPIEAKLADLGWTITKLLERLENQLVGQYLRDYKTDYGIYVIGTLGEKKHWEHPQNGQKLSFAEVIGLLSERASELVKANPRIGNLAVVGIDFSEQKRT